MRRIGFIKSSKENENRRAIVPSDLLNLKHKDHVYIEKGYGKVLGYTDEDYLETGVPVVSREEILQLDCLVDPKIGDADYLKQLKDGSMIFGWVHAVQNEPLTDLLIEKHINAIAWEDMYEDGRHIFWRNNEVAGETAVLHALTHFGRSPKGLNVAILGRGNASRGAYKILTALGANIKVYKRRTEKLFRKEAPKYDILVNAIYWDNTRNDHIIYKEDLKRMKKGAMIIDVSCDEEKAIETSHPTTIEDPVYTTDGVLHYVVDHTPAIFFKDVSFNLSQLIVRYLDDIIEEKEMFNEVLKNATIIKDGDILDQKIIDFQKR